MENIAKELLKLKFPNLDLFALTEVIEATPNPILAVEILCGIEKKEVFEHSHVMRNNKQLCFKDFDKWTTKVTYTYQEKKSRGAYFPSDVKKEDINLENFDSLKCDYNADKTARYFTIETEELKTIEESMDLESWNNLEPIRH